MKLDVVIYTTSPTDWFQKDFPLITRTLMQARGVESVDYTIKRTKLKDVQLKTDSDGDVKFDWGWFKKNYTDISKGFNAVVLHINRKEKEKYGITVNGTYNNDQDNIFEFWLSANKSQKAKHYRHTEFSRIFVHEFGHGFARATGVDSNLVHEWDYNKKDIFSFHKIISFNTMNWHPYLDEPYFSNITQKFLEPNPIYKRSLHHIGIDHGVHGKTDIPVYMPCDGQITRVIVANGTVGNCAVVLSKDEQWAFRFAHLRDVPVVGTYKAGDIIGIVGSTGKSTGIHLHVDAWKDGMIFIDRIDGRDAILQYCVDPHELVIKKLKE